MIAANENDTAPTTTDHDTRTAILAERILARRPLFEDATVSDAEADRLALAGETDLCALATASSALAEKARVPLATKVLHYISPPAGAWRVLESLLKDLAALPGTRGVVNYLCTGVLTGCMRVSEFRASGVVRHRRVRPEARFKALILWSIRSRRLVQPSVRPLKRESGPRRRLEYGPAGLLHYSGSPAKRRPATNNSKTSTDSAD
jgi:hypothetical protein